MRHARWVEALVAAAAVVALGGAGPATPRVPAAPRLPVGTVCKLEREGRATWTIVVHGYPHGRDRSSTYHLHFRFESQIRVLAADHEVATRLELRYLAVNDPHWGPRLVQRLLHGTFIVARGAGPWDRSQVTDHGVPVTGKAALVLRLVSHLLMPPAPMRAALRKARDHPGRMVLVGKRVRDTFLGLGPHITLESYGLRDLGVTDGIDRSEDRYRLAVHGEADTGLYAGGYTVRVERSVDAKTAQPVSAHALEQGNVHGTLARPGGLFPFDQHTTVTERETVACRPGTSS